jgi:ribosomal protein S18 acetylase RimI-like enzyme
MRVRSISPDELASFCAVNDDGWLEEIVAGFWTGKDGFSRPEWCFLLEDGDRAVGRVFFFHLPSSPDWLILFGLHLDWQGEFLEAGRTLLNGALEGLDAPGVMRIERRVYDIYSADITKERSVYEAVGFRCVQEKRRFVWEATGDPVDVPDRLAYRPMTETGETAYIEAIRRVTVGTLDRDDQESLRRFGAEESARRYLGELKDTGFRADRLQLAYLRDGELCGLVAPCRDEDEEGAINYIGVLPEHRGNGYGYDLVLKANAVLQPEGCRRVVAETDSENVPLHHHLLQAGYVHKGTLWCLRLDLAEK